MSSILAIVPRDPSPVPGATVARVLDRMRDRGRDARAQWNGGGATLAVARHGWELAPGFSGSAMVAHEGGCAVAADATLFYTGELAAKLESVGVRPREWSPAHLILAAYRAWGEGCVRHLEGDFAFLLWDGRERRLLGARDFAGKRPLFFAELGGALVAASTLAGVAAHPGCPEALDLAALAATMAGLPPLGTETVHARIRSLPAGWTLQWRPGGTARLARFWEPPVFERESGVGFEEAAAELRHLLARAVEERLAPEGPTSVWLSGGWDSTAVYGAGQALLGERADGRELRAVSMSYPEGDPGREDELIESVVGHWSASTHWVRSERIPLLDRPRERAAGRDEPFAHAFEHWNRALVAGSRAVGTRVALDGCGGDQLFMVTPVFLADLARRGRLGALLREWRGGPMRGSGWRSFVRWAVLPALPPATVALLARLTGRSVPRGYLEPRIPSWLHPRALREHGLLERTRPLRPRRPDEGLAAYESAWYLTNPYFPHVFRCVSAFALEDGVELRSPLYDERIVRFAATRPRQERMTLRETKRLLRRSVAGLLPDPVLAPRATRTGITAGYFTKSMRAQFAMVACDAFAAPHLADLGLVDPEALRSALATYLRQPGASGSLGIQLFLTLQTELWLRARPEIPTLAPREVPAPTLAAAV